jgi:hypothetical protein
MVKNQIKTLIQINIFSVNIVKIFLAYQIEQDITKIMVILNI